MRNLKKLLALVLAMMMAFSLMLTANAANPVRDYPDADQADEAFEEAIDVLTGMKVYSGDNGNFKPAATITRAEVAALIYRLATGDTTDAQANLYAEYGNFPDVPHDAWYAGYVGYCANAGYIKGRSNGNFDPSGNVTGYEALAMILRAIGYDKNGEFTGATWQTEVSALSQQLGILDNVKTTQYGGTLYLAARRDVVADLLFRADAYVNMVKYTPAFGYQPYGDVNGSSSSLTGGTPNNTLGWKVFGLTWANNGVVIGNQQTGETNTRLGWAGSVEYFDSQADAQAGIKSTKKWSAFAWEGTDSGTDIYNAAGDSGDNVLLGYNDTFKVETGIDLFGHHIKIWYDGRGSRLTSAGRTTYAYFDKAKTDVVYADTSDLTASNDDGDSTTVDLGAAIDNGTDLKVAINDKAVFTNSFGRFGTLAAAAAAPDTDEADLNTGDGVAVDGIGTSFDNAYASPVGMYKIIDNNGDGIVDAVIAMNIESSRITETNTVNRVPTIGLLVENWAASPEVPATGSFFVEGIKGNVGSAGDVDKNLKNVGGNDVTGVLAQAALVGNSVKNLGDYEFGIHITGTNGDRVNTSRRTISKAEGDAINQTANTDAARDALESSYFLLHKVEATVTGTVVAYNVNAGTVTLDNGTVLERSDYYHTVVGYDDGSTAATAPVTAIPQGWVDTDPSANYEWHEGYANVTYKFYTDFEGKYLGAERTFGSEFLYGTYLDYSSEVSSSTFNYYLTGVTLEGKVDTKKIERYWDDTNKASLTSIPLTGTDQLGVPFRDTYGNSGNQTTVNGMGVGVYTGFTIMGTTADSVFDDPGSSRNEYLNNMARLGIYRGDGANATAGTDIGTTTSINNTSTTLGAEQIGGTNRYFTEGTKFILVEGFGTDTAKAEVYNGITELRKNASQVIVNLGGEVNDTGATPTITIRGIDDDIDVDTMTYYTESPYTYAQSGATAMKIDTIILPKAAVTWSGGSGLYYVGDPSYTSINSWGIDAWKYNLYQDGELQQVWLTNDPSDNATPPTYNTPAAADDTYTLVNDVFLHLKDTGEKANDGQPIYTAGQYDRDGVWHGGVYLDNTQAVIDTNAVGGTTAVYGTNDRPQLGYMQYVEYSATTRDAQTAIFGGSDGTIASPTDSTDILMRVAEAKVVNLNAKENCINKPSYGYIWPGITDLATLNQAGSINPVTGRPLKVSAVVDPTNNLIVTCIYVCYDQTP